MKLFVCHNRVEYEDRLIDEGYAIMAPSKDVIRPALLRYITDLFLAANPGKELAAMLGSIEHTVSFVLANLVEVPAPEGVAIADFCSE